MEKYIEENPLNKDSEDNARINKNDISKKVRTGRGFISIEEIPEKELSEVEAKDIEEGKGVEDYYDKHEREETEDYLTEKESEEKRIEQLNKELKYHEGAGVASVYTEEAEEGGLKHNPTDWGQFEKPKKEDEFKGIEREVTPRMSRRKTNDPITSMSPEQIFRESKEHPKRKIRKEQRIYSDTGNTGTEHDNLKTLSGWKKAKSFRQKIMDFFMKQNNEETQQGKLEQMYQDHPLDQEYKEPTLNGKPMDKRFLDEEDRAA